MATRPQILAGAFPYLGEVIPGDPEVAAKTNTAAAVLVSVFAEVLDECVRSYEWIEFLTPTPARALPDEQLPQDWRYSKVLLEVPANATYVARITHPQAIRIDNPGGQCLHTIYGGNRIVADKFDFANFYDQTQRPSEPYVIWHGAIPRVEDIKNSHFLNYLKIKLAIRALPAVETQGSDFFDRLQVQAAEAFNMAKEFDSGFEGIGFSVSRNFPRDLSYDNFFGGSGNYGPFGRREGF